MCIQMKFVRNVDKKLGCFAFMFQYVGISRAFEVHALSSLEDRVAFYEFTLRVMLTTEFPTERG